MNKKNKTMVLWLYKAGIDEPDIRILKNPGDPIEIEDKPDWKLRRKGDYSIELDDGMESRTVELPEKGPCIIDDISIKKKRPLKPVNLLLLYHGGENREESLDEVLEIPTYELMPRIRIDRIDYDHIKINLSEAGEDEFKTMESYERKFKDAEIFPIRYENKELLRMAVCYGPILPNQRGGYKYHKGFTISDE